MPFLPSKGLKLKPSESIPRNCNRRWLRGRGRLWIWCGGVRRWPTDRIRWRIAERGPPWKNIWFACICIHCFQIPFCTMEGSRNLCCRDIPTASEKHGGSPVWLVINLDSDLPSKQNRFEEPSTSPIWIVSAPRWCSCNPFFSYLAWKCIQRIHCHSST